MWSVIRLQIINLTGSNEFIGRDRAVNVMLWTIFGSGKGNSRVRARSYRSCLPCAHALLRWSCLPGFQLSFLQAVAAFCFVQIVPNSADCRLNLAVFHGLVR